MSLSLSIYIYIERERDSEFQRTQRTVRHEARLVPLDAIGSMTIMVMNRITYNIKCIIITIIIIIISSSSSRGSSCSSSSSSSSRGPS